MEAGLSRSLKPALWSMAPTARSASFSEASLPTTMWETAGAPGVPPFLASRAARSSIILALAPARSSER